jgi:four helix bundle protein
MMYFQNLQVWQKAFELASTIHILLRSFPAEEKYALTDQMRRSSLSIVSNIAEGNRRSGNAEYAQFLSIAKLL